jgi:teichuronic acid biosynthesis glycosyltransferase TuaG
VTDARRPVVSVVIPVHNGELALERAVRSVLDQTFCDLEVVVVDDASVDGSFAIANRLAAADQRVRALRRSQAAGDPATPRDDGISVSSGDYVAFLDHDDFWLPRKLARQLPLFGAGDVAVVYSQVYDDEGTEGLRLVRPELPSGDISSALLQENHVSMATPVVRRDWVERAGRFDRHHLFGLEDYYYWLRISLAGGRFVPLLEPTAVVCRRPDSFGRSHHTEILGQWPRLWTALACEFPARPELAVQSAKFGAQPVEWNPRRSASTCANSCSPSQQVPEA